MDTTAHTPIQWHFENGQIIGAVTTYKFRPRPYEKNPVFLPESWYIRRTIFVRRDFDAFIIAPSHRYFNLTIAAIKRELLSRIHGEV